MTLTDNTRTLLLPVETMNREFDGKLLLALLAAERGFKAIIGGRTLMHAKLHQLPRSIYFSKGIRSGSRVISEILQRLGHVIVALDEEALIRFPDEVFLMKLDDQTFNRAALLFAWGKSNADVWRKFKGYRNTPIIESGNPRVDMLRPEVRKYYQPHANHLIEQYGSFVLLSSNFSFVNHFIPNYVRFNMARDAPKAKVDEARNAFQEYKRILFRSFLDAIPSLAAAVKPNRIIIRPHPSEARDAWVKASNGVENVEVIHEGPMAPWLMAAKALVHNSCTSAVEAALLGTPSFAFMPVISQEHDFALPNSVSQQVSTVRELCERVSAALSEKQRPDGPSPVQRLILDQHIASIDGSLASDRIVDLLVEMSGQAAIWANHTILDRLVGLSLHHRRNLLRMIKTRRRLSKSSAEYTRHKFPSLQLSDVQLDTPIFSDPCQGLRESASASLDLACLP